MSKIIDAFNKAYILTDYNIHKNLDERYEFRKKTISEDESLNPDEKKEAIRILSKRYDYDKIISNEGIKRICDNCKKERLALSYCEHCVRNYLKKKFSDWTSNNNKIDNLIKKCQMQTIGPNKIIEWIPYSDFQDIKYFTKGGFSNIYLAKWINGHFIEWNSDEKRLKRNGMESVILKDLESVESAKRSWFEEAKSHLTISNKWAGIIQCYGLTQNPSNGNYMLVVSQMDIDLRSYLLQNRNLTWKERIKIIVDIIDALLRIHKENAIHRDLHSGNILHLRSYNCWYISDLGFCGPADKPLGSIYGNLPYIAPEVIAGRGYTEKSDIYSVAMLMWEISSGQPPFINYEHNYDLAMDIVAGKRPKIVSGTPLQYKELMERCWNANPKERPNIDILWSEMMKINKSYHQNNIDHSDNSHLSVNYNINSISTNLSCSKIFSFNNLPEPRNATKDELEGYHSIQNDLGIPNTNDIMYNNKIEQNDENEPEDSALK
ncbi:kinase-like domain-containing protein [Rhizophagus irregularis DAOM 181602=DAOM 197198]|uniref:Skm1p n=2 Tax=Rhizophagus irregularis TaxID=588596 RepID=A0A015JHJ6_RHIIW|nr:Skm1p [Rhizophagus irregularis DAOM 197198w]GBC31501.1 kinase-like domain-containing protein [Rhizophagus irregularis DAOM 181602=DAOM 197198]